MTKSRRRVAIFLWAALMPFVTVACIFSLVLWTHPEWHSSSLVAPIGFGTAMMFMYIADSATSNWGTVYLHDGLHSSHSVAALALGAYQTCMVVGRALTDRLVATGQYRMMDRSWLVSAPDDRTRITFAAVLERANSAGVDYLIAGSVTRGEPGPWPLQRRQ